MTGELNDTMGDVERLLAQWEEALADVGLVIGNNETPISDFSNALEFEESVSGVNLSHVSDEVINLFSKMLVNLYLLAS